MTPKQIKVLQDQYMKERQLEYIEIECKHCKRMFMTGPTNRFMTLWHGGPVFRYLCEPCEEQGFK